MGETHFLARLAAEVGTRHHMFFDKPINELTDGRLIAETLGAMRQVPFVGDTMADIMAQRTGLRGYTVWDSYSGSWKNYLKVEGGANHTIGSVPWSRSLRDAAALTDEFLRSSTAPHGSGYEEVPVGWNVLDAASGIRITQADPVAMKHFADMKIEKQLEKYLESKGLLKSYQSSYVPFKK